MDKSKKLRLNNVFRSRRDELFTNMRSIFSTGRNGYLHRFTTTELNQTSTGTTPVTAVTDPVGLLLDTRLGLSLGAELVDTINTAAAWTASGTNTVADDAGAVKITYVDNAAGAVALFSAAAGLSANLVVGANYKITYEIKVNSGSVNAAVVNALTNQSVAVTSTDFITQSFVFTASSVDANSFTFANMSAGEIVWIKNISVRLLEGNHAIQATSAARSTWTNRVNDALATEDFNDAAWTRSTTTVTASAIPAPNGLMQTVTNNGAASYIRKTAGRTSFANVPITVALYVTQGTAPHFQLGVSDLGVNYAFVNFNLTTLATTNRIGGTGSVVSSSITAVPTGGYLAVITVMYSNALTYYEYQAHTNSTTLLATTAGQYGYSWGAQLVIGSILPCYQRVTTATNFDTAGFPYYLSFLGTDDNLTSATGGGGTLGFFWCGVIQLKDGTGTVQTIFADNGVNTGYKVQKDASEKLSFSAGNGAAFTTLASTAALSVGTKYLLTVRDNGTNLSVQINSAAAETVARPIVSAGTAGFTIGKDNGAASSYLIANKFPAVYFKDTGGTDAEVAAAQAYCMIMAGMI